MNGRVVVDTTGGAGIGAVTVVTGAVVGGAVVGGTGSVAVVVGAVVDGAWSALDLVGAPLCSHVDVDCGASSDERDDAHEERGPHDPTRRPRHPTHGTGGRRRAGIAGPAGLGRAAVIVRPCGRSPPSTSPTDRCPGASAPASMAFSPTGRPSPTWWRRPTACARRWWPSTWAAGRPDDRQPPAPRWPRPASRSRSSSGGNGPGSWPSGSPVVRGRPDADRLLVPMADGLWVLDGVDADPPARGRRRRRSRRCSTPGSPTTGGWSGYVAAGEVHVAPVEGGAPPRPVTAGGSGRRAEPRSGRVHRPGGDGPPLRILVLRPTAAQLAFCEVDETAHPRLPHRPPGQRPGRRRSAGGPCLSLRRRGQRNRPGRCRCIRWQHGRRAGVARPRLHRHRRRPLRGPGRLGDATARSSCRSRLGTRSGSTSSGSTPTTGVGTLLLREESETWINLHDDLRFFDRRLVPLVVGAHRLPPPRGA